MGLYPKDYGGHCKYPVLLKCYEYLPSIRPQSEHCRYGSLSDKILSEVPLYLLSIGKSQILGLLEESIFLVGMYLF